MSQRKELKCELLMDRYIAHPYWSAREELIRIQRDSGMNRQKSDEKRAAALKAQLNKVGLTIETMPGTGAERGKAVVPRGRERRRRNRHSPAPTGRLSRRGGGALLGISGDGSTRTPSGSWCNCPTS